MSKTQSDAEARARNVVNQWTAGAFALSWLPGSTLVLGTADYAMIRAVASAFDVREYDQEAVVGVIAACATGKSAAEVLSFIPGPGWLLKAAIAAALTKAMGEAVIAYFRERSTLSLKS